MNNEAFVYTYSNKITGELYVGYHKGDSLDGYISSSKSEKFWEDYNDGNLKRSIIAEGTCEDCYALETKMIQTIGLNNLYNNAVYPVFAYTPSIGKKISDTLRKKKITPYYIEKTHSDKSLSKAKKTKEKNKLRWYHNPINLDYKMFRTSLEEIPNGWLPGRKPKKYLKKRSNIDPNAKYWNVTNRITGEEFFVKNLKKWCRENGIPDYLVSNKITKEFSAELVEPRR